MKREKAYIDGRRKTVLEMLKRHPGIRLDELAENLNVSVVTLRRDLKVLEDEKQIARYYGGARLLQEFSADMDVTAIYKQLIARYAATLVEDEDTIFINTSSTALGVIDYIGAKNVTVITNNGKAMNCEETEGVNIILTGGELRHPKEAMVGDFAIRNLQSIFAKKAFIGCSGFSIKTGMTTENANEVNVNQLMIEHALPEIYLLADHTKIGHNSSFISSELEQIKYLITDELAPREELDQFRQRGVRIIQVRREDF